MKTFFVTQTKRHSFPELYFKHAFPLLKTRTRPLGYPVSNVNIGLHKLLNGALFCVLRCFERNLGPCSTGSTVESNI